MHPLSRPDTPLLKISLICFFNSFGLVSLLVPSSSDSATLFYNNVPAPPSSTNWNNNQYTLIGTSFLGLSSNPLLQPPLEKVWGTCHMSYNYWLNIEIFFIFIFHYLLLIYFITWLLEYMYVVINLYNNNIILRHIFNLENFALH